MSTRRKGHELVESLHDYSLDLRSREIYLVGDPDIACDDPAEEPGVEYRMAARLIKNIRFLSSGGSNGPVLVHMSTTGGMTDAGMAIYDAIRSCPHFVTVLAYAPARSMSSIILQAADRRVMMPHAYFMFHHGTDGFDGTHKQLMSYAEWAKRYEPFMVNIYAHRMKTTEGSKFKTWSLKRIKAMLEKEMDRKEEVYLTPTDTVQWGLADQVFDGDWDKLIRE